MIPYVFTVITQENDGYFQLLDSAKRWGWPLQTHFVRRPQGSIEDSYESFIAQKHLFIYEILKKVEEESFLFVDGWDTAFIGPPPKLFPSSLLYFSGSSDCYPEKRYAKYFKGYYGDVPFPYLNTGVMWGNRTTYLKHCPLEVGLDQLQWTREFVKDPRDFHLDYSASVVLTSFPETLPSQWSYKYGTWIYLPTASTPSIIHAAGKSGFPTWLLAK